jgi:hypothetical protein
MALEHQSLDALSRLRLPKMFMIGGKCCVAELVFQLAPKVSVAAENRNIYQLKGKKFKKKWSREWELNPRPADYESAALPLSYLGL